MKKYPTDNFYIGNLNVALPRTNIIMAACGAEPTNEEKQVLHLMLDTVSNGAVHLEQMFRRRINNSQSNYRYNTLLTLFYRVDEDKYLCMHNGYVYSPKSEDTYCDQLVPLSQTVPKFAFSLPNEITKHQAYSITRKLFMKNSYNNNLYNNDKFNLDDFYLGNLELCTGYREKDVFGEYNSKSVLERILLNGHKNLYCQSGYSRIFTIDDIEYEADYSDYWSIFLKIDDENYYNINNYRIYNIELCEPFIDKVTLKYPIKLFDDYCDLSDQITIPKIIKKQKSIS